MPAKKPKPNQPCHCGSGKKYKKCCKVSDDTTRSGGAEDCNGVPLRFKIGDKVLANVNHVMMPGTIVQTNYREPLWPEGKVCPYQIELDDGALIYAPTDGDNAVQKYDRSKDESISTNKYSGREGKKQLRKAARFAEKELEERNKLKEDLFIPEEGNETTNQEEYLRAGMLEARYLPVDDVDLRYKMVHAGWPDLKLPPDVADLHSILNALERLFSCLPQLRKENAMLTEHDVEYFMLNCELLPLMCIAPEQFMSEEEDSEAHEPSEFVWDMVSLLGKLQCQVVFTLYIKLNSYMYIYIFQVLDSHPLFSPSKDKQKRNPNRVDIPMNIYRCTHSGW